MRFTSLRTGIAGTLMAIGLLLGSVATAAAASGTALGVRQDAQISQNNSSQVLTVGTDIFIGDRVMTGPSGQVQIKFSDKTELVVGPSSSLVIEDYLLRADNSAGRFAINALAGSFRFATGTAPKDKYLIKTPTGTIGVRGTAFDFNVDEAGTKVLLFHGSVLLCNLASVCVTLDDTCEIGQYDLTDSEIIGPASETTGAERAELKSTFKYAQNQSPLLRAFWVEQARQCFNRPFVNDVPPSLVNGDSTPTPPVAEDPGEEPCPERCEGDCCNTPQ